MLQFLVYLIVKRDMGIGAELAQPVQLVWATEATQIDTSQNYSRDSLASPESHGTEHKQHATRNKQYNPSNTAYNPRRCTSNSFTDELRIPRHSIY